MLIGMIKIHILQYTTCNIKFLDKVCLEKKDRAVLLNNCVRNIVNRTRVRVYTDKKRT